MSENIEKLPKWAQGRLRVLEDTIKGLRHELSVRDAKEPTRIYYETGCGDGASRHYIPNAERIAFMVGDGSHGRGEFEVYIEDGEIVAYCRTDSVKVMPVSSNVVRIGREPR